MAKKSQGIKAAPVALGFVQLVLHQTLPEAMWQIQLDEPLYFVTGESGELLELPVGTVLYLEPGGMQAWIRVGKADESDEWPRVPYLEEPGINMAFKPFGEEEIPV